MPDNMTIKFQHALANANDFSPIIFSAVPSLKLNELTLRENSYDNGAIYTQSGRIALTFAGQQLKRETNIILVPSYHCPAAIEPFIWLGFECIFYRVLPNLSPDLAHIKQLITHHQVTHCLTINYFGIINHLDSIVELTSPSNIAVIHDCAHALFDLINTNINKHQADATICSINKILPSIDGGMVLLKAPCNQQLVPVGLTKELKAVAYILGITPLLNKMRFMFKQRSPSASKLPCSNTNSFRYFDPNTVNHQCFSHTKTILRRSNLNAIRQKRRDNYQYLSERLASLSLGTQLKATLDCNDVPYVMPYLLNDAKDFIKIRQAGIQSLRWEEVAMSDCAISQDYRHRLVQLPCHHQLDRHQLDHMIAQLKATL